MKIFRIIKEIVYITDDVIEDVKKLKKLLQMKILLMLMKVQIMLLFQKRKIMLPLFSRRSHEN